MQRITSLSCATSILIAVLGLASCTETGPQIESEPAPPYTVTPVDFQIRFDDRHHDAVDLDLDNNGQTDFIFYARDIDGPTWGNLALVGILSGREGNEVVAGSSEQDLLCQMQLPMSPGRVLSANEDFGPASTWAADAMLYGRTVMMDGCTQHKKYMEYSMDRYIGVRFIRNGKQVYGYIKLVAVDSENGAYPESADIWKIKEFGYLDGETEMAELLSLPA